MPEFLQWKSSYRVGDKVADATHQKMVHLANNFLTALTQGKTEPILHAMLAHLIETADEHFRAEEKELRGKVDSEAFAHHREEHVRLLKELRMLDDGFWEARLGVDDIQPFLEQWFFEHMETLDYQAFGKE